MASFRAQTKSNQMSFIETCQDKPRKRPLMHDDEYENEEQDNFDTEYSSAPRRGRKECRRISGVYREMKSLESIGQSARVIDLVFDRLPLKEVMAAGVVCSSWYITACLNLRKRFGRSPILRLWNSQRPSQHLWCNWELHFHEQLLDGLDDEPMEECKEAKKTSNFPGIGTIISVGSRSSIEQYEHDDAKLPIRQDLIYMTSNEVIVTLPDFSYTGEIDPIFGSPLVVQSLFLPKSENFTLKAFAMEISKDVWSPDDIRCKVELPVDDLGEGQQLEAVLCTQYFKNGATQSFLENFTQTYPNVSLLVGCSEEEVGCNRIAANENALITGLSFYTGKGAAASVFEIEFEKDNLEILAKIEREASSRPHGFCFVFSHDARDYITIEDDDQSDEDYDWSSSVRPESRVADICIELRKRMPKIPILGMRSIDSSIAKIVDESNTNVGDDTLVKKLCYGILLFSYE